MCEKHDFDSMLEDDSKVVDDELSPAKQRDAEYLGINFRTDTTRPDITNARKYSPGDECWSDGDLTTRNGRPMRPVPDMRGGITQAQYGFIIDLLHEKNLLSSSRFFDTVNAMDHSEFDEYMHWLIGRLRESTKTKASELITTLLALPKKQAERVGSTVRESKTDSRIGVEYEDIETDRGVRRVGIVKGGTHDVLAGRYALDTSGDQIFTNDITFFKVWVGDRGGWKVRMYKSDETIDLSFRTQVAIIHRIAADPVAALALWGEHKSSCGVCGRKLTNDVSRSIGIGPICRARWSY